MLVLHQLQRLFGGVQLRLVPGYEPVLRWLRGGTVLQLHMFVRLGLQLHILPGATALRSSVCAATTTAATATAAAAAGTVRVPDRYVHADERMRLVPLPTHTPAHKRVPAVAP